MADAELGLEIERRLLRESETSGEHKIIAQSDILSVTGPVVILGDPGLGKSVLARWIGREEGFVYVRATSFVREAHPEALIAPGECLVIDGLDEIASASVGGGVDAVLTQLSKLHHPRFIISSREVDWRGASDRIKIEDDYGQPAVLLHLLPFERADAELYLSGHFPSVDGRSVLDHLAERGLDDIYKNPLTLRLIGEIASGDERLPASRAQLIDRACRALVQEENPRHQDAAHAHSTTEALMLAAGAHAAAQLLCNLSGVFNGPEGGTPKSHVHVSEVADLPHAQAAEQVLHTRLFEAEGSNRFHLLHRVIAEYLGAKWLAQCFQSGVSARRIFGLFGQGHGVPTSLRGLHAWIAHFDHVLADHCIAADPYAVLRYGDADNMPMRLARRLLAALAQLSERDPFFRSEDWGQHPANGLMKVELKDDILAIIGTPEQHTHLTLLLVEAMPGSDLAAALESELRAMMFDRARYFGERKRAADALCSLGAIKDHATAIENLLAQSDQDSHRLAWELLHDLGLATVPMDLVIRSLFAHIGITICDVDRDENSLDLAHISDTSVETLDVMQLCALLDLARDYAQPLLEDAKHSARAQVVDLVCLAGLRALTFEPSMAPADIWRRLGWLSHTTGYRRETRVALVDWLSAHPAIRRAVQAHVIFDAGLEHVRDAAYSFYKTELGFYPSEDDVIALIGEFDRRRGDGEVDWALLEELVLLAPRRDGICVAVRAAAAKVAAGSAQFLARLDTLSKPIVYEWQAKEAAAAEKREVERAAVHQSFRDRISSQIAEVDAGAAHPLYEPAHAYLGRYLDFSHDDPPEARVRQFLGTELGDRVLEGFLATLKRADLPAPRDIAANHAIGKSYFAELPIVCGVAERLRRRLGLNDLTTDAREAAFMAVRRFSESQIRGGVDLKPLEKAVLVDRDAIERFFRNSIEPQLEHRCAHVDDLYFLSNDDRWSKLAGRLAIEWLQRYLDLPATIEVELLDCAARHGELDKLRALARGKRAEVHRDYETMLAWLSLEFLVDFEDREADLMAAAADDPEFLWFVRNRISSERGESKRQLSIAQRAFIVEQFSAAWPRTERPQGTSSGDTNPWNATSAIESSGYALGGNPSPEATRALEHLLGCSDPSYRDPLRHALAQQMRARRDGEYGPLSLDSLRAVTLSELPATIDDMRAYFADRLETLAVRMHGSNTDMWEAYWDGDKPRTENFCRNRLIEHISGQLPEAIRFEPEMHMPQQKRADIAAILGRIGLPVEIKRQWHPDVWIAPVEQLEARYMREWHAEGRGAYIVLWFGEVEGRSMAAHPQGLPRPETPEALRTMLIDLLPEPLRDVIDAFVVDVSRP